MTRPIHFKILPSVDGQWYPVMKAGNNEVLFIGETYRRERDARHAVSVAIEGIDGRRVVESADGRTVRLVPA